MQGEKTGGRKTGKPNKKTSSLIKLIEEKHPEFNPVLSMVELCQDRETTSPIRVICLKELANYIYAKCKAREIAEPVLPVEPRTIIARFVSPDGS